MMNLNELTVKEFAVKVATGDYTPEDFETIRKVVEIVGMARKAADEGLAQRQSAGVEGWDSVQPIRKPRTSAEKEEKVNPLLAAFSLSD